jgi:hypothetical protein
MATERFSSADVERALQVLDDAPHGHLWPSLSQAVREGDLNQVTKLHQETADLRHQDDAGMSALMLAAKQVGAPRILLSTPRLCSVPSLE